jgi:hypothetical protein
MTLSAILQIMLANCYMAGRQGSWLGLKARGSVARERGSVASAGAQAWARGTWGVPSDDGWLGRLVGLLGLGDRPPVHHPR